MSLSGDTATVKLKRSSACGDNCGSCSGCNNFRTVNAQNTANAKVGDLVEISMPSKTVLSAAVLVYVLPIVILVTGYFIGANVWNTEQSGILLGLCAMVISYVVIGIVTSKNKNHYKSTVTKIL